MAPKYLIRTIAFLLVPCLIADPALAAVLSQQHNLTGHEFVRSARLDAEAFSMEAVWGKLPFSGSGVRDARHLGSDLVVQRETLFAGQSNQTFLDLVAKELGRPLKLDDISIDVASIKVAYLPLGNSPQATRIRTRFSRAAISTVGELLNSVVWKLRSAHWGDDSLEQTAKVLADFLRSEPEIPVFPDLSIINKIVVDLKIPTPISRIPPEVATMNVEKLKVSVRSFNALKNNNIETVGEFLFRTESDMLRTKNFNKKSFRELEAAVKSLLASQPASAWSAEGTESPKQLEDISRIRRRRSYSGRKQLSLDSIDLIFAGRIILKSSGNWLG